MPEVEFPFYSSPSASSATSAVSARPPALPEVEKSRRRRSSEMAAKQTYIWSTPFFDFEFVDIRTKRSKGEIVKGEGKNQRHSPLFFPV